MTFELLSAATAALFLFAASPALPSSEEERLSQQLTQWCDRFANDPNNAWGMIHGLALHGRDAKVSDGRGAAEVLVTQHLKRSGLPKSSPYAFDRYNLDGGPIEPRLNAVIHALVRADLPRSTAFKTQMFGRVTLSQLVDGVKKGFRFGPSDAYWAEAAWTLEILARELNPGAVFVNGEKEKIEFDKVMDEAFHYLESQEKKLTLNAHACGGQHFVQAVFTWARHPKVKKRWGNRLTRQIELVLDRAEAQMVLLRSDKNNPRADRQKIALATLESAGHALDTLSLARTTGAWFPSPKQLESIGVLKLAIKEAVTELSGQDPFALTDGLKRSEQSLYTLLVEDPCIAARGLRGWP